MSQSNQPTGPTGLIGRADGEETSLRLSLLDAQVVDADDLPVGRVDDLGLREGADTLEVAAVLCGQRHLGPRLGGITGSFLTWSALRLAHSGVEEHDSARISAHVVDQWSVMLKLRSRLADQPVAGLEKWLASRVVRRVPGADDEGI